MLITFVDINSLAPIHFNNMFTYGASLFWANIRAERLKYC